MNTVPIHNKLTVRLANLIGDIYVGGDDGITAATDGKIFSASIRNQRLHEAYTWIVNELVQRMGLIRACEALSDSIASQNVASTSSSGDAVNKDCLYPIRLVKSDQSFYDRKLKHELDADLDAYLNYGFAIQSTSGAQTLYVYARNPGTGVLAITSGVNVTLFYLKADRINSTTGSDTAVNTAPDITLNSRWHECVLLYAAWRLAADKVSGEWQEMAKDFNARASAYLPQPQGNTQ